MSSTKPTLSASISDLAPFVAAVLKDKTVMDLNKDIEELREELREREEERLLVEVTGRGGTPVHYRASLKDGEIRPRYPDQWNVCFEQKKSENGEDIGLPLYLIRSLEVRLGGIVVSDMKDLSNDIEDGSCGFSDNEEDSQIGNINFRYQDNSRVSNQYCISQIVEYAICSVGPVPKEDYLSLLDDNFGDLVDLINGGSPNHFSFNQETPVNLIINGVEFNRKKIGSLLSIVERMGISTTRAIANHTN